MKGIKTLSIPSRNASESPLVRCDNMVIARRVIYVIKKHVSRRDMYLHQTQNFCMSCCLDIPG